MAENIKAGQNTACFSGMLGDKMGIVGVGTDLVKVARVQRAIKRWNGRFLKHVFTPAEIEYCKKHAWEGVHFAARFAAKEALKKAAGGRFRWTDVEITNDATGKPVVRLVGQSLNWEKRKWRVFLSMSHTDEYAIASVIIESAE